MKQYFKKKVLFGTVVLFVALNVGSYIIHQILLGADYLALPDLWRPDLTDKLWIFQVIYLIQAYFLAYIFSRGYEGEGWKEGFRFGLLMALFLKIPEAYGQFVVYPVPYTLALKWFVFGSIEIIACGILLGFIFQKK